MKNEKYKNAIRDALTEDSDKSLAEQIGTTLLKQFQDAGAKRFFKNAGDEEKISDAEALESESGVRITRMHTLTRLGHHLFKVASCCPFLFFQR